MRRNTIPMPNSAEPIKASEAGSGTTAIPGAIDSVDELVNDREYCTPAVKAAVVKLNAALVEPCGPVFVVPLDDPLVAFNATGA